MKLRGIISIVIGVAGVLHTHAQNYTRQDSLRGAVTPERAWWDLTFYHLDIEVEPDRKYIHGKNTVRYTVLEPHTVLQIDLQPPLSLDKAVQNGRELPVKSEGNAHFITLGEAQVAGRSYELEIHYSGRPKEAVNPPWGGGITWSKDSNGRHFIGSSCQGLGASAWWPNKDHPYDEPDSMAVSIRTPENLTAVSNGRLKGVDTHDDRTKTWHWYVRNPINNYGVSLSVGDYVRFGEVYPGEDGPLDMDYWVLSENLEAAKTQFEDARRTIEAFEHWFGPYPFYGDSFKLVEAPFLGMEHQSAVAYGNGYENGYLGRDLSGSGWGLKFDYIIVHETGHEWFANNITYSDIADMWVHESFTTYSEGLFVEYFHGTEAGTEYILGQRQLISNDKPIIGEYGLNQRGSKDMYFKGANILHMLRQIVDDDEKWRNILRGLNADFRHQTVSSRQVEDYLSRKTGLDLSAFFDQYLRDAGVPVVEFKTKKNRLRFRYSDTVPGFDVPLKIYIDGKEQWITPGSRWKTVKTDGEPEDLYIDEAFYVYGIFTD